MGSCPIISRPEESQNTLRLVSRVFNILTATFAKSKLSCQEIILVIEVSFMGSGPMINRPE